MIFLLTLFQLTTASPSMVSQRQLLQAMDKIINRNVNTAALGAYEPESITQSASLDPVFSPTGDSDQAIQIYKWILTHDQDLTPDMKQLISKHKTHQSSSFPTTQTGIKNYFRNTVTANRLARYNHNLRSRRLNIQNRVACFVCIGFYI